MTNKELATIVIDLISSGKEGAYWDFKMEWHEKIEDLIKDIVCFTNTVHDKDSYIIFGVNDSQQIVGMKQPRRKQADIIDALSKLQFATVHTPEISVNTVILDGKEIDVLTVYNTEQTPVFLKQNYGKMKAGCIYARVADRNTPDNGNANLELIELLWKKRFGLTKPALSFILDHLSNKHEWNEERQSYYNIYRPEYSLQIREYDDTDRNADEFYGYVQTNESMFFEELAIIANNSTLMTHQLAVLDSGRLTVPIPEWGYIRRDQYYHDSVAYKYYVKDSDTYKLLQFLYDPTNMEQTIALGKHLEVVLLFQCQQEAEDFTVYCEQKTDQIDKYIAEHIADVHIWTDSDQKTKVYKERILTGRCLKQLLNNYRQIG